MADFIHQGNPELEAALGRLYREFFDQAERRRRWSLQEDVPWAQCNQHLDPAIADVVESFCAVELYLPDYLSKAVPLFRDSRARTWFYANWGYEESKHSLALSDWLLQSGQRSDEQMADLEDRVFQYEWDLPHASPAGMMVYAMVQELATGLTYRKLRRRARERGGDPALEKLLMLIAVDEQAHHAFFRDGVQLFLKHDPEGTLEQLRRVMNNFRMPAIHELAEGRQRIARIKELDVFSEDIYYREVYLPVLGALNVRREEMRNRLPSKRRMTNP